MREGEEMSGKRQPPRPRDRIIGARLRALRRERTELSLEAAAKLLGWSLAAMSRLENGKRHVDTEEVAMVLLAYKMPSDERRAFLDEARAENASGWWDRPLPGVPAEMGTLASYAVDADSMTDWAVKLLAMLDRRALPTAESQTKLRLIPKEA
jgi:transcriptional regulator with XRE-family HTH domain